jgi:hypothetical protein
MPPTGSIKTGAENSARMLFSRAPPAIRRRPAPAYGWMVTAGSRGSKREV